MNKPIDNWRIKENERDKISSPIGYEYKVIVRSCERLEKYRKKNDWKYKWDTFIDSSCSECFISGDFHSGDKLYFNLLEKKAIAVRFNQSPSPEIFPKILNAIYKSAIPVALWIRQELQDLNIQAEIDDLLGCSTIELPEKVKDKRLQASSHTDKQTHIGHHISLLWENPYILPPKKFEYTTP